MNKQKMEKQLAKLEKRREKLNNKYYSGNLLDKIHDFLGEEQFLGDRFLAVSLAAGACLCLSVIAIIMIGFLGSAGSIPLAWLALPISTAVLSGGGIFLEKIMNAEQQLRISRQRKALDKLDDKISKLQKELSLDNQKESEIENDEKCAERESLIRKRLYGEEPVKENKAVVEVEETKQEEIKKEVEPEVVDAKTENIATPKAEVKRDKVKEPEIEEQVM